MFHVSNRLHGGTVFSKIDLVKGYHQIPVATADIPKTAIIMPFGRFEYLFMPFGLSNAAQAFQRMMDRTLDGLEGTFPYMDDSRVGSLDRETHLRHLEAFFAALAANGLAINLDKCVFAVPTLEFLASTFRLQDRLRRPVTPPPSKHAPPLRTSSNCNIFSPW
jgi:cytoskeleton-associated protein 5